MAKYFFDRLSLSKSFLFIGYLLLCLGVSGCVAPRVVHKYEGTERPLTEVAVLHHTTDEGIKIFEVDGKSVLGRFTTWNPDAWEELHLTPGEHTLSGGLYRAAWHTFFREKYYFDAGKQYRLVYEIVSNNTVKFDLVEVE